MRPIYIFVPYFMGEFDPARAALTRHTWRLLTPPLPAASPTERMAALGRALATEVQAVRAAGHLPVVVAGDCTATIGVVAGLQAITPDFTLVWYDAHGDFNTPETTPSGFIGGMPLAMLCGRGEQTIITGAGAMTLPEATVILTDARNLDPGEKEAVANSAITHLPNPSALLSLSLPDRPIYLHFDPDVLRLEDLSAIKYPAQGGSSLETIEASLSHLAQTGQIVAISVTMWEPSLDEDNLAEETVMGVIDRLVEQL